MLEEETYEDVDPPTHCCGSCLGPVIRQEEAIELVEIKGDVKDVVEDIQNLLKQQLKKVIAFLQ